MRNDGAFCLAVAEQIAEVGQFIIEAAGGKGFIQFDGAAVQVIDSGFGRVPPVFVDSDITERAGDQGIAFAMQIKAAIELRVPVVVLRLEDGKHIHLFPAETAHGLQIGHRPEPV